jgi:uncharacterized protein YkwD
MTCKIAPRVEALEVRDCPATVNLFNGVLTVVGTEGNDNISLIRNGDQVGTQGQWFSTGSVARVVISAGGGDDVINDQSGYGAVIYGGNGNDTILGGRGHDTIYGGHGNDNISGDRGSDTIYGGGGNNTINGGLGNNNIVQGSPAASRASSGMESQIVQLINNYRIANGVGALSVNGQLNMAADLHSLDMAVIGGAYGPWTGMQHELFGTTRPEVTDRLDAAGYDTWTRSYAWGENIAFGYNTAATVVNAWINSPEHRANILNGNFTETGVSVRVDSQGILYFTQVFGSQS